MKQSNFMSLNWRDLLHTFLLVLIAAVINFLQETFIPALDISPEIKSFLLLGTAYLGKKFFEKSETGKPSMFAKGPGAGIPDKPL